MALRNTKWLKLRRLAAVPAIVAALSVLAGTAQAQFFGDRYYGNDGGLRPAEPALSAAAAR